MIDSKLNKIKTKTRLVGSKQNIIDFEHTYSQFLKGILVWTKVSLQYNLLIINYLYSHKYAHENPETQFLAGQYQGTAPIVQKLKFLKIDEVSQDYKVMQSKIKKNMVMPMDGLHQKIRTI